MATCLIYTREEILAKVMMSSGHLGLSGIIRNLRLIAESDGSIGTG
jgi:hypothetical protein